MFFMFVAIGFFAGGDWSTGSSALLWAPALLISIPFQIFSNIAADAAWLAPVAFVGLLFYLQAGGDILGEGIWAVAVMAVVVVALGV